MPWHRTQGHSRFTLFEDAVFIKACYENNKSPFESWNNFKTDSPFTIVAKLFFTCKNLYFVNDKVRAGCPKLGHTIIHLFFYCYLHISPLPGIPIIMITILIRVRGNHQEGDQPWFYLGGVMMFRGVAWNFPGWGINLLIQFVRGRHQKKKERKNRNCY